MQVKKTRWSLMQRRLTELEAKVAWMEKRLSINFPDIVRPYYLPQMPVSPIGENVTICGESSITPEMCHVD